MRPARLAWVTLVTLGVLCVLASIATNLAATIFPTWMEYDKSNTEVYQYRGIFQNCEDRNRNNCLVISDPKNMYHDCLLLEGACNEKHLRRTRWINTLRILNWTLLVCSLGLETFVAFGCIVYLMCVRYCLRLPNAQGAQNCLTASGILVWVSAILTVLGIIAFEATTMIEGLTTEIVIPGMIGRLQQMELETLTINYGMSSSLSWSSAVLGIACSWLWIGASYVQPPPHITPPSMLVTTMTSSTTPLYPIHRKQRAKEQEKQENA